MTRALVSVAISALAVAAVSPVILAASQAFSAVGVMLVVR